MISAADILIALLRNGLTGSEIPAEIKKSITDDSIIEVLALAKKHDLSHVAADASVRNNLINDAEMIDICKSHTDKYVSVYESQRDELRKIDRVFEDNSVPHINLKGAVMRQLYPKPWYRSCCDIDILVKEEDLDRAVKLLAGELGYTDIKKTTHDVGMWSGNGVHIELHYTLIEDDVKKNGKYRRRWKTDVLSKVWDMTENTADDKYRFLMSDEMFYFYHIAHMAKHIETGGCGIKPFMDLWLLNNNGYESNRRSRESLLKKYKLLKFERGVRTLSEVWFSGREYDEVSSAIADYIIGAGVYGNLENNIAFNRSKAGGRSRYLISRIFPSRDLLKVYYPALETKPWLLPLCQAGRWGRIIWDGRLRRSVNEISFNSKMSEKKVKSVAEMIDMLGL